MRAIIFNRDESGPKASEYGESASVPQDHMALPQYPERKVFEYCLKHGRTSSQVPRNLYAP